MNSSLTETQSDVASLAAEIFGRNGSPEQVTMAEESVDGFDHQLWRALAESGLLGVVLSEAAGGLGLGMVEFALVCEQLGKVVAPVPLIPTLCAAMAIAEHGTTEQKAHWLPGFADGSVIAAIAPVQSAVDVRFEADGTKISGHLIGVPWAHVANLVLVPSGGRFYLIDPAGQGIAGERCVLTSRENGLDLRMGGVSTEPLGEPGAVEWLRQRWLVALAATAAGVTDGALRLTASYTSEREQFGKPLSTFQGVALKAADAYLDTTAIRAAARQAAWKLDAVASDPDGEDSLLEVLTAAWWAAEAGQHCVHLTQHLHGGMGADITYPVHRYFLWGKQIELLTGGASALLAELGEVLLAHPTAGDAVAMS
jgi:acyl-CoA dehydrogenase